MHRFFLPPENCKGDLLRLDGREAHHALHVLRMKRGDEAIVLDGVGNEFLCIVEEATKNFLSLRVAKKNSTPPSACSITLLVGIPKGKIIESIIQKSVELGVRKVVPLLTERVVTRLDEKARVQKQEQWQQVAIEAVKQCGATWLPEIAIPMTAEDFIKQKSSFDLQLVGSLQKERRHPREIFQEFKAKGQTPKSVGVWVGPEGDFTLEELREIQDSGAQPISLGQLTLRVETAAVYCLSLLNYEFNS